MRIIGRLSIVMWLASFFAGCAYEPADGRPYIWSIYIKGCKKMKAGDIEKLLAIQETSFIPFTPKKYLDPYALDIDRKRIEAYYQERGYFHAKVTNAEAKPRDKRGKSVNVYFTVDEGVPTLISDVEIKGLDTVVPPLQPKKAQAHFPIGSVFDHAQYKKTKDHILDLLKRRGYAWADVEGNAEVDRDRNTAHVIFVAKPGLKATFGWVDVRGTQKTAAWLVKRHAAIPTGKTFDPVELEDARAQVYGLNVFSSVKVAFEHDPAHPDIANIIITVQEGPFRELRVGGGVGMEGLGDQIQRFDAHLLLNYMRYNFLGRFRTLRLTLKPAWVIFRSGNLFRQGPAATAEAELTQPDWLWSRLSLRFLVGYDLGIELAYQYTGPRFVVGLSRPFWHSRVNVGLSYNFQFWKFFNTDAAILQQDPAQAGRLFGYQDPYRLAWLEQNVTLDLRDKPRDTHYGAFAALNLEEGGTYAGGAFWYEKLSPDLRGYIPLGSRLTVAGRLQYGKIYPQGDTGSPISRRFYLGGPSSHRGFTYNRLAPQVVDPSSGGRLPVGGDEMLLMQGEARLNLFKLFNNWFGVVGFFDAGDVTAPSCPDRMCGSVLAGWSQHIDFTKLHLAVGGGLRYHTVIGTIRVDIGARLNRLKEREGLPGPDGVGTGIKNPDPGQQVAFHISIGEAF